MDIYLENGEDVGTSATAVPDWSVGDVSFKAPATAGCVSRLLC